MKVRTHYNKNKFREEYDLRFRILFLGICCLLNAQMANSAPDRTSCFQEPPEIAAVRPYTVSVKQIVANAASFNSAAAKLPEHANYCCNLKINGNGTCINVRLLKSSGDRRIDDELSAAIQQAGPFPKPPNKLSTSVGLILAASRTANATDLSVRLALVPGKVGKPLKVD